MEAEDDLQFTEFLKRNKRNINCLVDKEKNIRLKALKEFNKDLFEESNDAVISKFWRNHLLKPLVLIYDDKVEKLRELAIEITSKLIDRFELKDEAQVIISGVVARMDKIPFPEQSEEVRIEFLELLQKMLEKNSYQFVPQLSDVTVMISKILLDLNPDMKNKASNFCVSL